MDIAPGSFYIKNSGTAALSYPLRKLTRAQYSLIGYKDQPNEYPDAFYYDTANPIAQISVCGVPSAPVEYHFMVWQQIAQFATLTTQYNFAPGYARLLKYSLAKELEPSYSEPMSPSANQILAQARRSVKRLNAKVPILNIQDRDAGARFNILNNQP